MKKYYLNTEQIEISKPNSLFKPEQHPRNSVCVFSSWKHSTDAQKSKLGESCCVTRAQNRATMRRGGGLALTSCHPPAWEPVISLIMWLPSLMPARGEASPAVSINEPSLKAALISRCMGALHNGAFVNSVNPKWIFGSNETTLSESKYIGWSLKTVTSCVGRFLEKLIPSERCWTLQMLSMSIKR